MKKEYLTEQNTVMIKFADNGTLRLVFPGNRDLAKVEPQSYEPLGKRGCS